MGISMMLIDSDKLIEALDEYGILSLQSDILPGPERVYNVVRSAPIIDAVPMDYHKRCLEEETKKRMKAEKRQKLTEETNRKIIENYLPVVRCTECEYWTKQADSIQGRCALLAIYPTASWFCANGTMRTDND